jgi:tRNA1(Val) A37 N6-methylase TrmN6
VNAWPEAELSRDAFLGGALHLWQPRRGYRAGVDPVLLAASVPATSGQSVLDLGCGAGAAALCLATRVPGLRLAGVDRHAGYAVLARRNAAEAGQDFEVHAGDLADMPAALKARSFDHVLANPPYFERTRGTAAPDAAREAALGESMPLESWVQAGARRLKPKGYMHMILKADRLAAALAALDTHLGSLQVLPLAPRTGRRAELVILRARKAGRARLRLHAPVILHEGAEHPGDRDHYSPQISAVLRCGATLAL